MAFNQWPPQRRFTLPFLFISNEKGLITTDGSRRLRVEKISVSDMGSFYSQIMTGMSLEVKLSFAESSSQASVEVISLTLELPGCCVLIYPRSNRGEIFFMFSSCFGDKVDQCQNWSEASFSVWATTIGLQMKTRVNRAKFQVSTPQDEQVHSWTNKVCTQWMATCSSPFDFWWFDNLTEGIRAGRKFRGPIIGGKTSVMPPYPPFTSLGDLNRIVSWFRENGKQFWLIGLWLELETPIVLRLNNCKRADHDDGHPITRP